MRPRKWRLQVVFSSGIFECTKYESARENCHAREKRNASLRVSLFSRVVIFPTRSNIPRPWGKWGTARSSWTTGDRVSPVIAGGDFPVCSTLPEENEGLLVVVEQPETECLWLVVIAGGDFPVSSIISEENEGLRVVEFKCNPRATS